MLKLIGEVALAGLSLYSAKRVIGEQVGRIKDQALNRPAPKSARELASNTLDDFARGGALGATIAGTVLAFPVAAPVGAVMLVCDVVKNRKEITEFVKDMPASVKSTYQHAREKALGLIRKPKVEAKPSDLALEVADALERGDFEPSREYVVG